MNKIIILALRMDHLSIKNFLSHTLVERKIHTKKLKEKAGKENNDEKKNEKKSFIQVNYILSSSHFKWDISESDNSLKQSYEKKTRINSLDFLISR